ncbi:MAG: hypothetical protein ACYCX4_03900 [Bacillota bacterium]
MGMTGTINQQSGVYACPKCKQQGKKNEIPLSKGEKFPPCNTHGGVDWVLVRKA